jgi:ectoine hydroxylase-related dioxygenase (phytanoyl-CoA dioxygenase family)
MYTATTVDQLAEEWNPALIPETERSPNTQLQHDWARNGVVILPNLLPEALLSAYEDEWMAANGGKTAKIGDPSTYDSPMGWQYATPYMDFPRLRALCCAPEIASVLEELIGEPAGVHLNLTGWQSTRRNWHFDQYLNEPYVGAFYVAIWIALDDISADSGPFEYIPSSHQWWPPISQAKMRAALGADGDGHDWPTHSERILTPIFEEAIKSRQLKTSTFLAKRGDVLFWHSRLLHRGSIPNDSTLERRALIAHYSGVNHRPDMPEAVQQDGGWFFPLGGRQPVR